MVMSSFLSNAMLVVKEEGKTLWLRHRRYRWETALV